MTYDTDLRDRLAHARSAEPTDAELARLHGELRRLQHAPRRRRRRRAAALLAGLLLAVPATALAAQPIGDALDSFLGLTDATPVSLDLNAGTVIDEQADVRFAVIRSQPDDVCLSLDRSVEICGNPRDGDWQDQLGDHAVAPVGTLPPKPRSGPVPFFVLTAPDARYVEVTYQSGRATTRRVGNGGAVVLANADRGPREIIARDNAGGELGRADISKQQWAWCYREAGCPEMND